MYHLIDPASPQWQQLLREGAAQMGITIPSTAPRAFALHARELLHWNRQTRLTAITDPLEVAVKHFLDSLTPAPQITPDARLLDIGSGGGFPALPLKVVYPDLTVTMIDASRKKVSFLRHVIRLLKLSQIDALHTRAEALTCALPTEMPRFDVIVCRALGPLESFVVLALPLLAKGGKLISLKGPGVAEELHRLFDCQETLPKGLPPDFRETHTVNTTWLKLPFLDEHRTLVTVQALQE